MHTDKDSKYIVWGLQALARLMGPAAAAKVRVFLSDKGLFPKDKC